MGASCNLLCHSGEDRVDEVRILLQSKQEHGSTASVCLRLLKTATARDDPEHGVDRLTLDARLQQLSMSSGATTRASNDSLVRSDDPIKELEVQNHPSKGLHLQGKEREHKLYENCSPLGLEPKLQQ